MTFAATVAAPDRPVLRQQERELLASEAGEKIKGVRQRSTHAQREFLQDFIAHRVTLSIIDGFVGQPYQHIGAWNAAASTLWFDGNHQ